MDAENVARLREDLSAASYRVETLRELWGDVADAALLRGDRVPARRALAGRGAAAAVLARLFVLGDPVSSDEIEGALPSVGRTAAEELGLVAAGVGGWHALVDLRPYDVEERGTALTWWIASDLGELATVSALRTDHVLGVGGASATLAGLQLPSRVGRGLDLGTGSGIQALHLASRSEHVIATDISERALAFARLSTQLSAVEVELRQGSLFEPVQGERFDRIVSNPPFVITPRHDGVPAYEYRDGGLVGDALLAQLIAELPDHLEPGGVAQLLGNWEYGGRDGLERAVEWAESSGLEHWIIERETQDVAAYAETWIRDGGTRSADPEYESLVSAWLDDFDSRGVTAVGFGYLLLRRPARGARPTLARAERLDAPVAPALGEHLGLALDAHDSQAALTDPGFLELRLLVRPDVTEERHHWPGEEHPTVILLRQGGGFRRDLRAGTALAAVVGACDGELSLGEIVSAVARILDVDERELATEIVPELREMLVTGFLVAGGDPAPPSVS